MCFKVVSFLVTRAESLSSIAGFVTYFQYSSYKAGDLIRYFSLNGIDEDTK